MSADLPVGGDVGAFMRSVIKRIATGPELSKDLPREEAREAMRAVLEGRVHPVEAGVFLIALRMKRETDDENQGVLEAIRAATTRATAAVEDVFDIADPYDGFIRTLPATPFLPALLAACGVPAVSHGVESMGPKYGVTHRQVLRAAGLPVDLTPAQAAARIADPAIGWAYVDQKAFCPPLYALSELRALIVKRPVLTTTEVLAGPVVARARTHLMTGYVHKPYPRKYALLARQAGFASALIVRGVEGGVAPSLSQAGKVLQLRADGSEETLDFRPSELGLDHSVRAARLPGADGDAEEEGAIDVAKVAGQAAERGLAALSGERGPTRDALALSAALCLWHLGREPSLAAALASAHATLDRGAALERLGRAR